MNTKTFSVKSSLQKSDSVFSKSKMSFNRMVIVHEEFADSVPTNCMIEGLESKEMFDLCTKLNYSGPILSSAQFAVRASSIIPILESMGYEFYKVEAHGAKEKGEAKWILLGRK